MSRDRWKELAVIYVIPLNTAWRLRIWWPKPWGGGTTIHAWETDATYKAEQTCRNEWAEFGKFRCSECWTQVDAISTNTTRPMPIRYCPNCGRKIVAS